MTKINISEHTDAHKLLGFILIHAMTDLAEDADIIEMFHLEREPDKGFFADIKLSINGVESNLEKFAERLDAHIDKELEKEARRMVREAIDDLKARGERYFNFLETEMGLRECDCRSYREDEDN